MSEKFLASKYFAKVLILVTFAPIISPYLWTALLKILKASISSSFCAVILKTGVGRVPLELISNPSAWIGAGK